MISSVITTKLPENTPWGPSRNPYILESSREHCMLRKWWKNTFKKIQKIQPYKKTKHIKTSCLSKQLKQDNSLFHALMPSKMPAMTLWPPGAWFLRNFLKDKIEQTECLPARQDHTNLQGILHRRLDINNASDVLRSKTLCFHWTYQHLPAFSEGASPASNSTSGMPSNGQCVGILGFIWQSWASIPIESNAVPYMFLSCACCHQTKRFKEFKTVSMSHDVSFRSDTYSNTLECESL